MNRKDNIDFVITWVNANDENWQNEKSKYSPNNEDNQHNNNNVRYRYWDNLHYWFRGIEKFTPWVNKIHFITYGHVPEWQIGRAHV